MYTLEQLQQKNLKELKEIGWQLNVVPEGDRRCRQNWIDALIGVQPPLLQLLEDSPGVEPVQEAIEVQATEPIEYGRITGYLCRPKSIETPPGVESKFGRIVYPKSTVNPIAETRPQLDRTESADVHNWRSHPAESVRDSSSAKAEALGSKEGDRVLAVAGNSEAVRGGILPCQPIELAATFNDEQPPNRGDGKGRIEPKLSQSAIVPAAKNHLDQEEGITLSSTFLARYSPPQSEIVRFQSDADGQLSLLNFTVETSDEPPDPDDFESLDAFREAMARWDAENSEALMGSMDSMCEWAPCPDDWYEPEPSEVMEVAPSSDHLLSSSDHYEGRKCWNFSIPTFDAWCDRAARQTDTDEPPDTGSFAKLPGPKPPKFPPMSVVAGDRANSIRKFARGAICAIGRAPPGGDAMH